MNAPATATLVGIDCATDARKVGIALATWAPDGCALQDATRLRTWDAITDKVASWCTPQTLIALDAPLGWPAPLGSELGGHTAGAPIDQTANALFRRTTDVFVTDRIGKRPLDVGADRIARTAHSALAFLGRLRVQTGLTLPLAWQPGEVTMASAIEVYPAATLHTRGWVSTGYKGDKGEAARGELVTALKSAMAFSAEHGKAMRQSDHVLDAALCCLAASDFLRGDVLPPVDHALAEREGWIWVRDPNAE